MIEEFGEAKPLSKQINKIKVNVILHYKNVTKTSQFRNEHRRFK